MNQLILYVIKELSLLPVFITELHCLVQQQIKTNAFTSFDVISPLSHTLDMQIGMYLNN